MALFSKTIWGCWKSHETWRSETWGRYDLQFRVWKTSNSIFWRRFSSGWAGPIWMLSFAVASQSVALKLCHTKFLYISARGGWAYAWRGGLHEIFEKPCFLIFGVWDTHFFSSEGFKIGTEWKVGTFWRQRTWVDPDRLNKNWCVFSGILVNKNPAF